MRICVALTLCGLLLFPPPGHSEPSEAEPLQAPRVEVKEQGTHNGEPFVTLAFKPLPRDAALEQFTEAEARVFVQAMEDAFGQSTTRPVRVPSALVMSSLVSGPPSTVPPNALELERRLRAEYEKLYGPPVQPLPERLPNSKFAGALKLSPRYMPEGVRAGAQEMLGSETVVMAIVASGMTYLALWLAPDPAISKAIATSLTIGLMVVYGVSEIINVARAFMQLYREAEAATNLEQLESAARRFGQVIGKVGLRIMAMVAGGALGKSLPNVPKGGLGALTRPPRQFVAVGPDGARVTITVSAGSSSRVNVSTGTAVLMGVGVSTTAVAATTALSSARTAGACRPDSDKGNAKSHHIATDKNDISDAAGGPWTPLFEALFARAGMSLQHPANIVNLIDHKGPHPEEYHKEISQRLETALGDCMAPAECKRRLVGELEKLAADICKPGSRLNMLLTK